MSKTSHPFVSVIMPAYNAEKFIEETIESVRSQTFTNWELIIVDDGSTDKTGQKVKNLQAIDDRLFYLHQQNRKQAAARNSGMNAAKGEWIAFIDSDDVWLPNKLEVQLKAAEECNTELIFTNGFKLLEANNQLLPYNSLKGEYAGIELYKILFSHNPIAILSVMMKTSLIQLVGLQDENPLSAGCEDWDYWLRCSRANVSFLGLDDRTFKYRVHEAGTSQNILKMRIATCYVLFKNFESAAFSKKERSQQIKRLKDIVGHIVNALYERNDLTQINYYLDLLKSLTGNNFKYKIAGLTLLFLQKRSKLITNYFIYH